MHRPTIQELLDLTGCVALVTGARHLGYDAAEALAELGATVVLTSRDAGRAAEWAGRLCRERGATAIGMALEVTDPESWRRVVDAIEGRFGRLDVLVNNAGGRSPSEVRPQRIEDMAADFLEGRDVAAWRATLDTNLTGAFLGCRAVAPAMKRRRRGKIISLASIDGVVGRDLELYNGAGLSATVPDYLASKAGIIGLTRGVAAALAPHGIQVNAISPGGFERGQPEEFVRRYAARVPLGRMGRDGVDIKGAVAYLATAASDYVTGHNLVVDGGWTAW